MPYYVSASIALTRNVVERSEAVKVGATEFSVIQTVTNVDFDKCLAARNQTSALVAAFPLPRGLPMIVPPFTEAGNLTEVIRRVSVPLECSDSKWC
jgi:hypothetical protein